MFENEKFTEPSLPTPYVRNKIAGTCGGEYLNQHNICSKCVYQLTCSVLKSKGYFSEVDVLIEMETINKLEA